MDLRGARGGRGSVCLKTKFQTGSVEVLLFSYPLVPVRIKIREERKRRVRNWPLIKFSKGNSARAEIGVDGEKVRRRPLLS